MPLTELKSYRCSCDQCGVIGETWREIPEAERERALPDGWELIRPRDDRDFVIAPRSAPPMVLCSACVEHRKAVYSRP